MTNLHKIRARIRSVNSTQQITRTMKMIAVSKLRKTQTSLAGVRLFADKGQEVLNALLADDVTFEHPYLTPRRRVGHVCYVVFWGNRGLCGAYNQVLLRGRVRPLGTRCPRRNGPARAGDLRRAERHAHHGRGARDRRDAQKPLPHR